MAEQAFARDGETVPTSSAANISSNHQAVVIETAQPIRSSGNPVGICALIIGLFLALHTPAWVLLVFYKEDVWSLDTTESAGTIPANTVLLRFLSRWLLEFTPWFANAMLSVFLGVLFLYLGFATLEVSSSKS
jgi:hypothetical protein